MKHALPLSIFVSRCPNLESVGSGRLFPSPFSRVPDDVDPQSEGHAWTDQYGTTGDLVHFGQDHCHIDSCLEPIAILLACFHLARIMRLPKRPEACVESHQ